MSSYGGQVAFPGNSMYHATKWGIEGSTESVAQEFAPFGVGISIVEPGGARTEFRYGSAQVADALPDYAGTPARSFEKLLDPNAAQAPSDPARMATAIITTVDIQHAPLRIVLGSQALDATITTLEKRTAAFLLDGQAAKHVIDSGLACAEEMTQRCITSRHAAPALVVLSRQCRTLGRSLVTAAWISATRARSRPHRWSTPTRLSRSHRTHCSSGIATRDHAITVLRSCSSIGSAAAGMLAGAPPTGW